MVKRLVLLPGLDGTGELFADFIAALPSTIQATAIGYPTREFLTYAELLSLVRDSVANLDPFVLLGESFSSPLAATLAGLRPPNLAGLILCAGFVSNPFPHSKFFMKPLARPFLFRSPPPKFIHKYYTTGWSESEALIRKIRTNLAPVAAHVLAGRVQEILNCDVRDALVRADVPVMYLQAAHDRLIRRHCAEEIQRLKPGVRLVSLSAPHLVLQRKPREAVDAIMKFVRDIESGQAAWHS